MSENALHYGEMNEQRAREILRGYRLGDELRDEDLSWISRERIQIGEGGYTADELEAIAWWMRNKAT